LLSELSGREEPKPAKAGKITTPEPERAPKAKSSNRKPSRAQAEQTVKAVKPEPEQANDGPLLWQQSITDPALRFTQHGAPDVGTKTPLDHPHG
jgi:hypothetical protein